MTVHQLLNSMDAREIVEWGAYFKIKNGKSEWPKSKPEDIKKVFQGMAKALGGGKRRKPHGGKRRRA